MLLCCLFTFGKFGNDYYKAWTNTRAWHACTHTRTGACIHTEWGGEEKAGKTGRKTNWRAKEPGDTVTDIKQQVIKSN